MNELPPCPKCTSTLTYEDRSLLVCPECAFEWTPSDAVATETSEIQEVKDSNGTALKDGDSVTVIKDLKLGGGGSSVVKVGTKVKNIRIITDQGDHNIDCKVDGFGAIRLKSQFVRKI